MTSPRPIILRWSRFKPDSNGTGPEKRTSQITELIASLGFELEEMHPAANFGKLRTRIAGLVARLQAGSHASVDGAGIGLLGYRYLFYRNAISRHHGLRILIWETTYDTLLPKMARKAGYRILALPHNLESLVSEHVFSRPSYDPSVDLGSEVKRLKKSDAIFTISKEERWFLEARGLSVGYLPYFPDSILASECGYIRKLRIARTASDGSVPGPLLLLGAAYNPATLRGMQLQLSRLASLGASCPSVVVAGPETDSKLGSFSSSRVNVLGRIPREHLVELLISCKAMLIHTAAGAGAVTRIPEALLSGVPVIANFNASRDQHGTRGIASYETEGEFLSQCRTVHAIPDAPCKPTSEIRRFQLRLREMAGL